MSYALSHPSPVQRSALLSVVIGLHAGIFLLIFAARTVVPQIMELPLLVDLLKAPAIEPSPKAKPLPMLKPQPIEQRTPMPATPSIEAGDSSAPAPAAPVASAPLASLPESKPSAAAPVAEPLSLARFDADYLQNPAPLYPPLSRRMGEEGKVLLRVSVNAQGTANHVEIGASSGSPRLDDAALSTVKHWKFAPATRGETPIQSWVLVPIVFKLEQ